MSAPAPAVPRAGGRARGRRAVMAVIAGMSGAGPHAR